MWLLNQTSRKCNDGVLPVKAWLGNFSEKQTTLFLSQACKADSEASWMDFWWAWIDLGTWINRLSMSPCTATTRKIEFRNISVNSIAFLSPRLSLGSTQNHLPQVWSWLTFSQSNLTSRASSLFLWCLLAGFEPNLSSVWLLGYAGQLSDEVFLQLRPSGLHFCAIAQADAVKDTFCGR